jgi:hypothetical protein
MRNKTKRTNETILASPQPASSSHFSIYSNSIYNTNPNCTDGQTTMAKHYFTYIQRWACLEQIGPFILGFVQLRCRRHGATSHHAGDNSSGSSSNHLARVVVVAVVPKRLLALSMIAKWRGSEVEMKYF